ncbi:ectonucleotide pyrophosphatase/phosphodiesterase [soil metagenome]
MRPFSFCRDRWLIIILLCVSVSGCSGPPPGPQRTTVVWISIDGFRGDYVDRLPAESALRRMIKEGISSLQLEPVFPSITFPSHVSQATGAAVAAHGVSNNSFHDAVTGTTHKYPSDSNLLLVEPIWITAERQGARTAVIDWPLSHAQTGAVRSAYFGDKFDPALTDRQRLDRLLEIYIADKNPEPLRLVMGYSAALDNAGHALGPEAPEITQALLETDRLIAEFTERLLTAWREKMKPGDQLFVLLTTDHGMVPVGKRFNLNLLLADVAASQPLEIVSSGPVANVHLHRVVNEAARLAIEEDITARLAQFDFVRAYRRENLPAKWQYAHPTRVGDLVVVLTEGYMFDTRPAEVLSDLTPPDQPLGMHGYPVEESPQMMGALVLWRYPTALTRRELPLVRWDQLHPTVARLLGIKPAPGASGIPISLYNIGGQ